MHAAFLISHSHPDEEERNTFPKLRRELFWSGKRSWRVLTLRVRERTKAEKGGCRWIHVLLGGEQLCDAQENPRAVHGVHPVPVPSETVSAGPWGRDCQSLPCRRQKRGFILKCQTLSQAVATPVPGVLGASDFSPRFSPCPSPPRV